MKVRVWVQVPGANLEYEELNVEGNCIEVAFHEIEEVLWALLESNGVEWGVEEVTEEDREERANK